MKNYKVLLIILLFSINACAPQPPVSSPGHLKVEPEINLPPKNTIPPLVQQKPFIPPPKPSIPLETYTVVVENVAVDELLFTLMREANFDVDIHPNVQGQVTLNAIEKTLPQILERVAKQVDLRYRIEGMHIMIEPDSPYLKTYKINYVNMSRETQSEISVATQIASTGVVEVGEGSAGNLTGNNSTTTIQNQSNHSFWQTLERNISNILQLGGEQTGENTANNNVIVNAETGLVTIRANSKQHKDIQHYIDQLITRAERQVLIEATIVEVTLNDQYQAGVDWQRISSNYSHTQSVIDATLSNAPFYAIEYTNPNSALGELTASVRLLEKFGDVEVLSSPKIMALNNQTAILKVVDNIVYFTTEVEVSETDTRTRETYETEINTVPVGLVMTVTPQISENKSITLNVRPTISRVTNYKIDPNPALAQVGTTNLIPEIQVREMESILRLQDGNIAIIGGLMEDNRKKEKQGIPLLSKLPAVGDLFSYRDDRYAKTELVIFLRPVIIKQPSLEHDLSDYKIFLPE